MKAQMDEDINYNSSDEHIQVFKSNTCNLWLFGKLVYLSRGSLKAKYSCSS